MSPTTARRTPRTPARPGLRPTERTALNPAALRELYPVIGDETDDDPYCQCGNDPYEEEAASGKCASCGKELP